MKTRTALARLMVAAMAMAFASCGEERRMARGFVLPKGDVEKGKAAFIELKCNSCHSVAGTEIPGIEAGTGFELGGEVRRIKTYGELVTAVIDPKHDVAPKYAVTQSVEKDEKPRTPMPPYNSVMTVQQMSDIVRFLHSRYKEEGPDFPDYNYMP